MGQELELSYSIWIQASADEVWKALTEPALSSQYFPYALLAHHATSCFNSCDYGTTQ